MMDNPRYLPVELALDVIKHLPSRESHMLGLTNKHYHALTFANTIRKGLSEWPPFSIRLGVSPKPFANSARSLNVAAFVTLYNFAESEGGRLGKYIKKEVARYATRNLLYYVCRECQDPKIFDALLDHSYLFGVGPDIWKCIPKPMDIHLPMIKHFVGRGCKLPYDMVCRIGHLPSDEKLCAWLVENGLDIDARSSEYSVTALSEACYLARPFDIEVLLRLGANPNGIGPVKGQKGHWRLTRPLDLLLCGGSGSLWRCHWKFAASRMYRCVKLLIEYGASTARAPIAGDPIRVLLDNTWRLLCPVARRAAGVSLSGETTISKLLDALLTVDIQPLDELCDLVVDTNPEYLRRSNGLRGRERLVRLLGQRKNLPLKFNWQIRDRPWACSCLECESEAVGSWRAPYRTLYKRPLKKEDFSDSSDSDDDWVFTG